MVFKLGLFDAMFGNVKLGIQISNQVIRVLLKDKELFIYPVIMAILSFILLFVIFVPFVLLGGLSFGTLSLFAILVIYYIVVTFMATYFLFAMYIAFKSDVNGKRIGMMSALSQASKYIGEIISWTIFYTIVIVVIRLIESQMKGILAYIVQEIAAIGLFLGMTFAVPIIFEDSVGPVEAVKRSATFIINNIGKTFSGIIYFDVIAFVIKAVGAIFMAGAFFAGIVDLFNIKIALAGFTILGHTSLALIVAIFAIGIAIYIVGMLFNYVTLHIYYLVIYDYVKNGKVPKGMDESLMKSSIATGAAPSASSLGSSGGSSGTGGNSSGGLFDIGDGPDLKGFVK
ncbi:MAG: hypothetical protein KGH64_01950 [Candidatus Micrarchaeota archaeon]|nr:hypothetical protein [Candidatus Micrarchaeota archaeon]MDE1859793.1 hypothetical protein [Candidatus Micrarchaeota archaeon]